MNKEEIDNVLVDGNYKFGVVAERSRIFELLKQKRALRDSMLGGDNLVLYTETGAIDITWDEFKGESKQG